MSFVDERTAIEQRFLNGVDTTLLPAQLDNVSSYIYGTKTIKNLANVDAWCRLTINGVTAEQIEIGGNIDRYTGLIIVNIFTRSGIGSEIARSHADEIKPIFNRVMFDDITTRTTEVVYTPPSDGWYQLTMTTEYYRDEGCTL